MGLASTAAKLLASLELDTKPFEAGTKRAGAAIGGLEQRFGRIGSIAQRGLGTAARNVGRGIEVGVLAAAGGLAASVKLAADFEAQLNIINTVAQETPAGLKAIGDGIRELARTTGTSTEDLTAAYYDLVSAGIATADAQNVLTQANTLAIGGLATTAETVDLLTTAINSYGGDASKATEFTNSFAQAIAAGKTTASDLAASFAQVGPLAAKSGIELDELSAAIGVMTATGTGTSEAFTQIRSAMIALQRPTTAMKALQEELNVDFAKLAERKGLAFTYNQIAKAADKAGIPMIELTGRVEGTLFAAQVAGENFGKYSDELERVEHASDGAGVAQQQMAQRTQGAAFQFGVLKAGLKDFGITIGSAVLPKLTPLITKLNEFIARPENIAKIEGLARGIADAFDDIPWATIGDSLKIAGVGAKAVFDVFTKMPAWVQTAVLTGWGLNKLTGGALSGIIGELGKGLIKGVLGMNAGVVNAKAGVVNVVGGGVPGGGVPGVPAPAAAGGGFSLSALAAGALPITIAAFAPLALVGLTAAIAGGEEKIQERDLEAREETAAARGLDPTKVDRGPRTGPRDPFAEWVRNQSPVTPQGMSPDERQEVHDREVAEAKAAKQLDFLQEIGKATGTAVETMDHRFQAKADAIRAAEQAVRDRVESNRIATQTGLANVRTAEQVAADQIVAAIRALDLIVNVGVSVSGGGQYQANHLTSNKPKQFGV